MKESLRFIAEDGLEFDSWSECHSYEQYRMPVLETVNHLLSVVEEVPEYFWDKYKLTIICDGYLESGIRVHVVKEKGYEVPIRLSGAVIVSSQGEV